MALRIKRICSTALVILLLTSTLALAIAPPNHRAKGDGGQAARENPASGDVSNGSSMQEGKSPAPGQNHMQEIRILHEGQRSSGKAPTPDNVLIIHDK